MATYRDNGFRSRIPLRTGTPSSIVCIEATYRDAVLRRAGTTQRGVVSAVCIEAAYRTMSPVVRSNPREATVGLLYIDP